jgi:hypothetical protein
LEDWREYSKCTRKKATAAETLFLFAGVVNACRVDYSSLLVSCRNDDERAEKRPADEQKQLVDLPVMNLWAQRPSVE